MIPWRIQRLIPIPPLALDVDIPFSGHRNTSQGEISWVNLIVGCTPFKWVMNLISSLPPWEHLRNLSSMNLFRTSGWRWYVCAFFPSNSGHKYVGIWWCTFGAYGCTSDLMEMFSIKVYIIVFKNNLEWVKCRFSSEEQWKKFLKLPFLFDFISKGLL